MRREKYESNAGLFVLQYINNLLKTISFKVLNAILCVCVYYFVFIYLFDFIAGWLICKQDDVMKSSLCGCKFCHSEDLCGVFTTFIRNSKVRFNFLSLAFKLQFSLIYHHVIKKNVCVCVLGFNVGSRSLSDE